MIEIKGYINIPYAKFQKALHAAKGKCGKEYIHIAAEINVQTKVTAQNALHTHRQMVSDQVLTNVMKSVGLDGLVLWNNGERFYYIKK